MIYNTVKVGKLYLSSLVLSSIDDDLSAYATKSDLENYAKLDDLSAYAMKTIEASDTIECIFPLSFHDTYMSDTLSFNNIQGYVINWLGENDATTTLTYNTQTHEMTYDYHGDIFSGSITIEELRESAETEHEIILDSPVGFGQLYLYPSGMKEHTFIFDHTKEAVYVEGGADGIYATVDEKISSLSTVYQTKLADTQISAIDSVVDERSTYVKYQGGAISSFNIVGNLDSGSIPDKQNAVEVKIGNSVTSIWDFTFSSCIKLTSVTIPDSVTSIGDFAFEYCESLASITIPNLVTSIGANAFINCVSLTSVMIPDSVTNIKYAAFYHCINLSSVSIPSNLTSIGEEAFSNCSSLKSITIPKTIQTISKDAFFGCSSLMSVVFENGQHLSGISAMVDYPWGIENTDIISTWHDASQEWVAAYDAALTAQVELAEDITYAELVALKNQSKLEAGKTYRITDYVTTTVQADTSANESVLPIVVRAATSVDIDPAGYMPSKKCEIKYCIDNDTNRFAWADTTNGKGVIYWMRDIHGNECPYDFKSIMFKPFDPRTNPNTNYLYTFDYLDAVFHVDASDRGYVQNNTILPAYLNVGSDLSSSKQKLNNIVLRSNSSLNSGNYFSKNCYDISLGMVTTGGNVGNWFGPACNRIYIAGVATYNFFQCGNNRLYLGYGHSYERFGTIANVIFGDSIYDLKSFFSYNVYEGPILGLKITSSQTTSQSKQIRGIKFGKYLAYTTGSTPLPTLDIDTIGQSYEIEYKRTGSKTITFN